MKPHLIFDYDGTIHDTLRIYFPAIQRAFRWLREEKGVDVPEVPRHQAASWLGMNTRDMWNSFLPGLPMELKQKAALLAGEAHGGAGARPPGGLVFGRPGRSGHPEEPRLSHVHLKQLPALLRAHPLGGIRDGPLVRRLL